MSQGKPVPRPTVEAAAECAWPLTLALIHYLKSFWSMALFYTFSYRRGWYIIYGYTLKFSTEQYVLDMDTQRSWKVKGS